MELLDRVLTMMIQKIANGKKILGKRKDGRQLKGKLPQMYQFKINQNVEGLKEVERRK